MIIRDDDVFDRHARTALEDAGFSTRDPERCAAPYPPGHCWHLTHHALEPADVAVCPACVQAPCACARCP